LHFEYIKNIPNIANIIAVTIITPISSDNGKAKILIFHL